MSEHEAVLEVPILVVDDRPENRLALRAILSSPSYRILEAGSGAEALRAMMDQELAVILLDVVMPEMDGFELARTIKGRERTASIPIIFMTAQVTDPYLSFKGYEVGAVDFLSKPLVPEAVRSKVAVFAQLYRQRKEIQRQAMQLLDAGKRESEMRIMELALAGERRFRGLTEALPAIIWTAGPDGRVDYFNHRWFEYTGLSMERAGSVWTAAMHPDDRTRCEDAWRAARESGAMLEIECRLLRASDSAYRWHICRAIPQLGTSGQILSWLGTFTDTDDQKRAHGALVELKGMLDVVMDAVVIFDAADHRLLYVNHGAAVLSGYTPTELLALHPEDFIEDRESCSLGEVVQNIRDGHKSVVTFETKFRRRDMRTIPVEVTLQLVAIDRGRVIAIARDMTDRKRAQLERELLYREAVDAIRARDEFLSVASHELRTPLSSLKLQLEMMLQPPRRHPDQMLGAEQLRAKLEIACKQVDRLSRLVSELMDVSKITAGRLRLELERADLSAIVHDVVSRMSDEAARVGSVINVRESGRVEGTWDRMRVEQIVINLLANAFKFAPGKPIDVVVEERGPLARLSVTDHGIGIAPEDAERIFRRYEQAISSRGYGGMGLGLYIVRQIVTSHGGTIRVESQLGSGSTFVVDLPREPMTAATADGEKGAAVGVGTPHA
jgi:PAS domain S-box-containing protein